MDKTSYIICSLHRTEIAAHWLKESPYLIIKAPRYKQTLDPKTRTHNILFSIFPHFYIFISFFYYFLITLNINYKAHKRGPRPIPLMSLEQGWHCLNPTTFLSSAGGTGASVTAQVGNPALLPHSGSESQHSLPGSSSNTRRVHQRPIWYKWLGHLSALLHWCW